MNNTLQVTKRDGTLAPLDLDKIHKVLTWATDGLDNISVSEVELRAQIQLMEGISTSDIHETLIKSAADLITEETPDYQYMAARLNIFHLRKKAFGQFGFGLLFFAGFAPFGQWQLSSFDWLALIILGIVCTLIAHTLWIKVSSELPNSITATVYYFYVPIAMSFSYFIFNEVLTWQKIMGAALIIFANILVVLIHGRSNK